MKKILIFGVSGLIGYNFFKFFFYRKNLLVFGTCRKIKKKLFDKKYHKKLINLYINNQNYDELIERVNPTHIVNCIGITKHVIQKKKIN